MKSLVMGAILAIASTGAMADEQDLVGCGGVVNGTCGVLKDYKPNERRGGHDLSIELEDGKQLRMNTTDCPHLAHNFNVTVHKRCTSSYLSPQSCSQKLAIGGGRMRRDHRVAFGVEGDGADGRPVARAA